MTGKDVEYRSIIEASGALIVAEGVADAFYGEFVRIRTGDGEIRHGQVLEVHEDRAVVQVFEGTKGIDVRNTSVRFTGDTIKFGVSRDILGRVFGGTGEPIDGGMPIVPDKEMDINGSPINPTAREYPREFIQTGISTIDG
ncbi:MAG TPA: V-type ATP synthase subunit B, partial [Thermoplasmata archaeon]|nr:V-type ATP synthase subunit B [Thermoplasmata archaeon]